MSPVEYGFYPPIAVIGGLVTRRLAGRIEAKRIIRFGMAVMVVGATIMVAAPILGLVHKHAFNASMVVFVTGLGIFVPQTVAAALTPFGRIAGSAAPCWGSCRWPVVPSEPSRRAP